LLENEANIKVSLRSCKALFILFVVVLTYLTKKQPVRSIFKHYSESLIEIIKGISKWRQVLPVPALG